MYNWAAYEYICAIKSTICHSLYPLKTFTHHTTAACELHRSLVVLFTTAALYLWPNDDNVLLSNNTHFLFVYYHHQVLQCAPDTLAISVCHRHPTKVQVRNVEHFRFFHWDASQSVSLSVSQSVSHSPHAVWGTTIQKNPRGISSRILRCLSPATQLVDTTPSFQPSITVHSELN